jgi:hypothetical protein
MALTEPGFDEDDAEPPRRRSKISLVLGLVLAGALGYWLSPYAAAARFAKAANDGSVEAVLARTDIPALRTSIARQVVRAYIARDPQTRSLDPLARNVVAGVATSYLDAIIAEQVTPETLAGLLRRQPVPGTLLGEGVSLPASGRLVDLLDVFMNSGFDGLASFVLVPPPKAGEYRFRFGLSDWRWRLRGIDLPEPVLARLVEEFRKRRERGG